MTAGSVSRASRVISAVDTPRTSGLTRTLALGQRAGGNEVAGLLQLGVESAVAGEPLRLEERHLGIRVRPRGVDEQVPDSLVVGHGENVRPDRR